MSKSKIFTEIAMRRKRYRQGSRSKLKSGHIFNSRFEEIKTCEYLVNLINSKFLKGKPAELFNFAGSLLGQKDIVSMIEKGFPDIAGSEEFAEWVEHDRLDDNLPHSLLTDFLIEMVSPYLSKRISELASEKPSGMEARLSAVKRAFDLSEEEQHIVTFFFLEECCQLVDEYLDSSNFADFTDFHTFKSHGSALLGIKRGPFLNGLTKGNLFKTELMEKSGSGNISLSIWCTDYLGGIGESDITHQFFTTDNDESLDISDFDISRDEMMVLNTLLKSAARQNLLLYGAPGTGKTSFIRSLAKKCGRDLYTVKVPEDDSHKDRLKAIFATVNLADRDKAIVLVDEADEVLNTYKSLFFESKTNKSWINSFLESHDKKVIWITNRSSEIDQSTMRRFSFSMEFRKLDNKRRLKILKHELAKKGMPDYFDEEDLKHLCKAYSVDAGGIVNSIKALKISKRMKKETALKKITTVLKNHEKATCGRKGVNIKEREFGSYSLEGLNTSHDLKNILSAVSKFNRLRGQDAFMHSHALNVLLYGMPGTGKTEFVYYLGNSLEREVLLKRCSDIQDKYVGETEKNIARAFAEAQGKEAILFFDEADSFFYPRKDATRSWEKDFTNELLTQMESFKGIAMFATNEIDGLDHAAIRRFRFKIEFKPLTPEGNVNFYNSLLLPLVPGERELSPSEMKALKGIRNLAPGDFAVAKDQALFMEPADITHKMMIDSLVKEACYKRDNGKVIGFNA